MEIFDLQLCRQWFSGLDRGFLFLLTLPMFTTQPL